MGVLRKQSNWESLYFYQKSQVLYQLTFIFVQRYLKRGDRTIDQMVQAARSGKQNIAEGNQAATTSTETEIKLTNVAKASLEELLIDYEDYLRVRGLPHWEKTHPRYEKMRQYAQSKELADNYKTLLPQLTAEEIANLCITLIHQAIYMLYRLLAHQQERFVKQGGIREQMLNARLAYRNKNK